MTPTLTRAWLRLAFSGLPAGRCRQALERWGGPEELLDAVLEGNPALASTPGLTDRAIERLKEAANRDLKRPLEALETHAIRILTLDHPEYPAALKAIPDPPPYLFVRGAFLPQDDISVAIVGTRQVTEYGKGLAHRFAADLARRDITVVSGLARGVDTAAHRGALDGGGRTIAVTACGLDIVYPSDNRGLMLEIEERGAVISEWAPTTNPEAWHFPARNRIIAGLSAGVVVAEAAEKSGALITADYALEQGREVFAIPGNVHKSQSRGPHNLIKAGAAALIDCVDDIVIALNSRSLPFDREMEAAGRPAATGEAAAPRKAAGKTRQPKATGTAAPEATGTALQLPLSTALEPAPVAPRPQLSPAENRLWLVLDVEPRHIDDIAAEAGFTSAEANAALVLLELKGGARRLPGNLFARTVS